VGPGAIHHKALDMVCQRYTLQSAPEAILRSTDTRAAKASRVYHQLRDAILSGRLESGTYLRERELAARYRVSRTPIREVLRQLERDGQVRLTPHVGAEVREVSAQDLFDVLEMRRCLEPYSARIAAQRITPAIQAKLFVIRKAFEGASKQRATSPTIRRLIAADRRLHALIFDLAGNQPIAQAIVNLRLSIQRYRYVGIPNRFERNTREHLAIIDALLKRDPAGTQSAMNTHLEQFTADMRHLLLRPGGPGRSGPYRHKESREDFNADR
jgi:DNA-binding GntR family transcriptional regulator